MIANLVSVWCFKPNGLFKAGRILRKARLSPLPSFWIKERARIVQSSWRRWGIKRPDGLDRQANFVSH